jgi:SAM-dependent methyltransferase
MLQILWVALPILLIVWLSLQVRKPSGWLGKRVVRAMNLSHATMTDWGLQQVFVPKNAAILDVGCGGGRTVRKLAAMAPEGKVVGLDYSAASVAVSRETNAQEIDAGRVQIERGSVTALPFPDCTFDIVMGRRDALLLVRPAGQRPRSPESPQTRRHVRPDRRNLPRRTVPPALRDHHAAAPRCVPERRGAPGSSNPSGIHRGRDQAPARKELDLRHGPPAVVADLVLAS